MREVPLRAFLLCFYSISAFFLKKKISYPLLQPFTFFVHKGHVMHLVVTK